MDKNLDVNRHTSERLQSKDKEGLTGRDDKGLCLKI